MIVAALKSRLLRVFGSAVADQALLSAANFAVGLLLIRFASDSVYGQYILAFNIVALAVSAQGAWVLGPLTVLSSKKPASEAAGMIGSVRHDQNRFILRLALPLLLAVLPLALAGLVSWHLAAVLAATVLAVWMALRREFLRSLLIIQARSGMLLVADAVYVMALIASILLAAFGPVEAAAMAVLALAIAAMAGALPSIAVLSKTPGWQYRQTGEDAASYWREMRPLAVWATAGALIFWVASQGYNYVLALKLDIAAVAAVNATRLLLMPVNLITNGIRSMMVPMAARWLVDHGLTLVLKRLLLFVLGLALLFAIYYLLLWFSNDWILAHVLHKQIRDHGFLILMWSLLSFTSLVHGMLYIALLVRERMRELAGLATLCALATMLTIWPAIHLLGTRGAMWSLLAGDVVSMVGTVVLCLRELRRSKAAQTLRPA